MKIWRITGSLARTVGDIGMSGRPAHRASPARPGLRRDGALDLLLAGEREACSFGRKTMPTPYSPAAAVPRPAWPFLRGRVSGIWIRIPAPSPISGSAPTAPRWSRFFRISDPGGRSRAFGCP
jgi:hypothetical protein